MRITDLSTTELYYHGSPVSDKLFTTTGTYFFTKSFYVAKEYARGTVFKSSTGRTYTDEKKPTVYSCRLSGLNTFDITRAPDKETYNKLRQLHNANSIDPDELLPRINSVGFLGASGYPSFGNVGSIIPYLRRLQYNSIYVDEGSQGTSIAVFDTQSANIDVVDIVLVDK